MYMYVCVYIYIVVLITKLCLTLGDSMNYSLPGSSLCVYIYRERELNVVNSIAIYKLA